MCRKHFNPWVSCSQHVSRFIQYIPSELILKECGILNKKKKFVDLTETLTKNKITLFLLYHQNSFLEKKNKKKNYQDEDKKSAINKN